MVWVCLSEADVEQNHARVQRQFYLRKPQISLWQGAPPLALETALDNH